jgi:hypothetical protein
VLAVLANFPTKNKPFGGLTVVVEKASTISVEVREEGLFFYLINII